MDPDQIKANLNTKRIGRKVLVYRSTSSTNDVAAEYVKNRANDGLVIFAEEQTAGRGRAGRTWTSGRADSILCSIVLTQNVVRPDLLSLACAVAVAEAIGAAGAKSHAKIKWPNDIILNGKKVAGILLESRLLPISDCRMPISKSKIYVVGVGINCHQQRDSFPDELRPTATSIDIESGSVVDRTSLAKRLLTSMDRWLEVAQKDSGKVIEKWSELSIQLGHRTTLIFNGTTFTGYCTGVDPERGLILRLDTGGVRMFDAAHTHIAQIGRIIR